MIIGLIGNLGSGKDYITDNFIVPYFGYKRTHIISVADSLKVNLIVDYHIKFDYLYKKKTQGSRHLLQHYGTDVMRKKHGNDIWLRHLDAWVNVYENRGKDIIIIPDIRFQNEVDYVKRKNGIIIKVDAADRTLDKILDEKLKEEIEHSSEKNIKNFKYDYIINNSKTNENNVKKEIEDALSTIVA